MIYFISVNIDEEYRSWEFDCVQEILKEWWCDGMRLPSADDAIFGGKFIIDNEEIEAKTFNDVICELERIYWKKVNV